MLSFDDLKSGKVRLVFGDLDMIRGIVEAYQVKKFVKNMRILF